MKHRERVLTTLNYRKLERCQMKISFTTKFADRPKVQSGIGIIILFLAVFTTGASCTGENTPIKVGFSQQEITSIGRTKRMDSLSAWRLANVLGIVSPNIKRTRAIPNVAIRTPVSCPQTETAKIVPIAAAAVFTRLLP